MPGQQALKEAVLDQDWCSSCGMCVGLCPYIKTARDRACVIYPCGLDQGTCYHVCPKIDINIKTMDEAVFGQTRQDQALGVYRGIYVAKAVSNQKAPNAQYGGITSALAALALEQGLTSAMALAGGDALNPYPLLAQNARQVNDCAGSKYTGIPTLAAFNEAAQKKLDKPGLAGRPCQVLAVRKMSQGNLPGAQYDQIKTNGILLGIFCFWSLKPGFYDFLATKINKDEKIIKIDIPVAGPTMQTNLTTHQWPLDDLRQFIHKACNFCLDPTAEWADIAVGSTEYDSDWNTVMIRTEQGQALWDLALQKNIIDYYDYPPERLTLLQQATLNKKLRILENTEYKPGQPGCPVVPEDYKQQMLKQWGVING